MLKKTVLTILICSLFITVQAQTFKITDVSVTDNKLWNKETKALLGKSITLTFFDKTVRVVIPKQEPKILDKSEDNYYSALDEESTDRESYTWQLQLDKTVGVITTATVSFVIKQLHSPYKSARITITSKRF